MTGDEQRAVGADVDVHDPRRPRRVLDDGDLRTGRESNTFATTGEVALPRAHGETAIRSRPTNATPSPHATLAAVRSWTPTNAWSCRPVRTSQTRTARSAPSVASRVPSALNRVAKHAAAMCAQHVNRFAGRGIPEPRGAVGASGRDEPAVRAVPDREHLSGVAGERHELLARDARRECSPSRPRGRRPRSASRRARRRRRVRCRSSARRRARPPARARRRARRAVPARPPGGRCRRAAGSSRRPRCASRMLRSGSTSRFASRGGGQLASRREACIVSRLAAEDERERCESGRRRGEHGEPDQRRPPSPRTPPCHGVGCRAAPRPGTRARRRSGRGRSRPPTPRTARVGPRAAGTRDRAPRPRHSPTASTSRRWRSRSSRRSSIHPREPIPLGEDRLVRDLDRRCSSQRLAVEGEQAMLAVAREDLRRARRRRARAGGARAGCTLRRVSCAAGSALTRRRKTWRHAACAGGRGAS